MRICVQDNCGGKLKLIRKDGRFFKYPHDGIFINLPKNISIPTCMTCGYKYISDKLAKVIAQALRIEYERHSDLVEQATERHKNG